MSKKQPKYYLTERNYQSAIGHLLDSVEARGWGEYQIIAIARGGLIPAVWLHHKLKNPHKLNIVFAQSYTDEQTPQVGAITVTLPTFDLPTPNLLIVDDLIDTGRTILAVEQMFKDCFAEQSLTFHYAIVIDKDSRKGHELMRERRIVTYGQHIPLGDDVWVVFPYERDSDYWPE